MSDEQQTGKPIQLLDLLPNRESVLLGQREEGVYFEMSHGKIVGFLSQQEFEQLYYGEHGRLSVEEVSAFLKQHLSSGGDES